MDYTQNESYDCPLCPWSLRVEKRVWIEFPNQHHEILTYIQTQVRNHAENIHGTDNVASKTVNLDSYKKSPFVDWPDKKSGE